MGFIAETAPVEAVSVFVSLGLVVKSSAIKLSFFCFPAIRAALRLILKSLFLVEFLFTFGEDEFFVTVFADNSFVWHLVFLLCFFGIEHSLGCPAKTRNRHFGNVESLLIVTIY